MSKPPRLKGEALAAAVQSLETAWVPTVEISTLREGTVIPVASAASGLGATRVPGRCWSVVPLGRTRRGAPWGVADSPSVIVVSWCRPVG